MPFLLPLALWKLIDRGPIAGYVVTNIFAIVLMIPIMSRLIQRFSIMAEVDMPRYDIPQQLPGLLERVAAVCFWPDSPQRHLGQRLRSAGQQPALGF